MFLIYKLRDFCSALPNYNKYLASSLVLLSFLALLLIIPLSTTKVLVTLSNFPKLPIDFIVNTIIVLEIDYVVEFIANLTSPFILDIKTDWSSIYQYPTYINIVINNIKAVGYCWGLLISIIMYSIFNTDYLLMLKLLTFSFFIFSNLDYYSINNKQFWFCK